MTKVTIDKIINGKPSEKRHICNKEIACTISKTDKSPLFLINGLFKSTERLQAIMQILIKVCGCASDIGLYRPHVPYFGFSRDSFQF